MNETSKDLARKLEESCLTEVILTACQLRLQHPPCSMHLPCSSFAVAQQVCENLRGRVWEHVNISLSYMFKSEWLVVVIEEGWGMLTYDQI